ncbi:MAG: hypothetical protein NTY52_02910 [Actinobacteria bacterium]|nr:hypothetical protein [Actinomycetota bacterium]
MPLSIKAQSNKLLHDIPTPEALTEFMKKGWAESPLTGITPSRAITFCKVRRENLSKKFAGRNERI